MNNFQVQWARSNVYEKAYSSYLQRGQGYYILPAYDFSGSENNKAPKLLSPNGGLVTPDLLASKKGTTSWYEVKLKSSADLHRKSGRFVTGLAYRHWKDYLKVQDETGIPVYITFIHLKERKVLCETINTLQMHWNHTWEGDSMDRGGTIFFRFEGLTQQISLDELDKFVPPETAGIA